MTHAKMYTLGTIGRLLSVGPGAVRSLGGCGGWGVEGSGVGGMGWRGGCEGGGVGCGGVDGVGRGWGGVGRIRLDFLQVSCWDTRKGEMGVNS